MKRTWWVLGTTLLALACSDGFFFEPPVGTADLAVAFDASPAKVSAATLVSAFDKADQARIAMRRSSGTPVLDTIVPFNPGNPAVELALSFDVPEEGETFALVGELLSQGEVVFQGETTVTLAPDRSTTAELVIEPMVTGIAAPSSLTFDALFDTAAAPVYGLFSTGDSIPDIEVQWAILDLEVVELAPNGSIVSVGEGSTQAIAQSGAFADTTDIVVAAVVDGVVVSPDLVNADVDQEILFSATALDRNGNALSREASWSVDDESVAVIDSDGLLLTVEEGTATITAEIEGLQGTAQLTVTREVPLVATVTVEPDPAEVLLGGTTQLQAIPRDNQGVQLTGRPVEWSSSDPGVARISAAGVVTGVSLGSATITATVEGVSGDGSVEVVPVPVASVTVSPATATVLVGEALGLTATVTDANGDPAHGRPVTWESSATAVATVDSEGTVSAVGPGTATITATAEGEQGSAVITVPVPTPMAGGTYHLSDSEGGSVYYTAVLYDPTNALTPSEPIDQVTLTGPPGWHGDEDLLCIPFYLGTDGLAADRAVCLEFPDAITGSYTGQTPLGETTFSVDASSSIPIPVIDEILTSGTSIASVEWSGDPSHASYAVELYDLDAFEPLAVVIVPGTDRDATFEVSLDPDTEYGFLLVAFDVDLTAEGAPFPTSFNAAETEFETFFTASPNEFWVSGFDDASVTIFEQPGNDVIGGDSGFGAVHLADIVFTPDGESAWVADAGEEEGTVFGFDTSLGEASTSLGFGSFIERLALSPGGDTLYATSDDGILYHYDPLFDEAYATTDLGSSMGGLAVTPDGAKVYVSLTDGTVAVVSTSSPGSFSTISVGSDPRGVAVHGDRIYVANYGSNSVSVIDTSTDAVVATIPVGAGPEDVEVSPCGCFAYVVNQTDGTVSVIDTFTDSVVGSPIPVGSDPQSVAFAPIDELAYVTNYGDETVSVISTITDEVLETLDLGSGGPWGVAVFPHGVEEPSASPSTPPSAALRHNRRTR